MSNFDRNSGKEQSDYDGLHLVWSGANKRTNIVVDIRDGGTDNIDESPPTSSFLKVGSRLVPAKTVDSKMRF